MPSIITGLVVIALVPVANDIYWKRQKAAEKCAQDRDRRYELLGSVARNYTNLFKVHTELHEIARRISHYEKTATTRDKFKDHISALTQLRGELVRERIRLESLLAGDSALLSRYLPESASRYHQAATAYDKAVTPQTVFLPQPDNPLVRHAVETIATMEKEARALECS